METEFVALGEYLHSGRTPRILLLGVAVLVHLLLCFAVAAHVNARAVRTNQADLERRLRRAARAELESLSYSEARRRMQTVSGLHCELNEDKVCLYSAMVGHPALVCLFGDTCWFELSQDRDGHAHVRVHRRGLGILR